MGEPDRVEHLLEMARRRLRSDEPPLFARATASLFLASARSSEQPVEMRYTADPNAGAADPRRRYSGRSTTRSTQGNRPSEQGAPATTAKGIMISPGQRSSFAGKLARSAAVPWSFRLVLAVSLLSVLLVAWRLPGLFTLPVDAPFGVESTHAAFVSLLDGRTAAPLDMSRVLPPPAPWHGAAPANPASSLPVYDWLATGLGTLLGSEGIGGRLISILLSFVAGIFLFTTVRRVAGARAALYALLFYSVAPLSVVLGQQFSPTALLLAAQSATLFALVRWKAEAGSRRPGRSTMAFAIALLSSALLGLVDPGALFLVIPGVYVLIAPAAAEDSLPASANLADAWRTSAHRGKAVALACTLAGTSLLWWVFTEGGSRTLVLGLGDGGGGLPSVLAALLNGGTYVQVVGLLVEGTLTVAGLLLLGAGLLHGARPPLHMLFHAWFAAGLLHTLFDASRLPGHDDVMLPMILPACALAGIGAAWAGALPARLWLAIHQQDHDSEAEYTISPHTSWLLDLPEERAFVKKSPRPQAQLTLSKSVAQRSQTQSLKIRRAWLLTLGHVIVFAVLGLIVAGGVPKVFARLQPTALSTNVAAIGGEVAALVPPDSKLIVAGPFAPELFYATGHTGWALTTEDFSIMQVEALQRQGAAYLLSADQDWLGRHVDYRGLITSYSVLKLSRDYILFDLNAKPSDNDRLYFLESGHTLGGAFRKFWERNGGVTKLGYPISEELVEPNPLDGQIRTVQYFERAVLEYHKEKAGTADLVMLASVGRWVTQGRDFPRAESFKSTQDKWYFAETGHVVKQAFLRYWQQQGGLATFGYPISEELPEINAGDGKVYTVQYFERARFEWHPTFAGTPDEVQLGLIGKQALELPRK